MWLLAGTSGNSSLASALSLHDQPGRRSPTSGCGAGDRPPGTTVQTLGLCNQRTRPRPEITRRRQGWKEGAVSRKGRSQERAFGSLTVRVFLGVCCRLPTASCLLFLPVAPWSHRAQRMAHGVCPFTLSAPRFAPCSVRAALPNSPTPLGDLCDLSLSGNSPETLSLRKLVASVGRA